MVAGYDGESRAEKSIKVSLIIPVCNVEKYLRDCLNSACGQTLKEIEIICVEDCSEDSSAEILREYAEKDSRIIPIFHKENQSTSQARKDGVAISRGRYIMFLDGDDELVPEACEKAYDAIEKYRTDMVQFDTEIVNCAGVPESRIRMNQRLLKPCMEMLDEESLICSCWEQKKFGFSLWNKIYNGDICRKAFRKVKDGAYPKAQDLYAFFLIAYYSKTYAGIDEQLYRYKFGLGVTGRNIISLDKFDLLLTEKRVWEALSVFISEENKSETYLSVLDKIYDHFLIECITRWKSNLQIEDLSDGFRRLTDIWGLKAVISKLAALYWESADDIAEKMAEVDYFKHNSQSLEAPRTIAMYYRSIKNGGAQRVAAQLCNIWAEMCDENGEKLYKVVLITDEEEHTEGVISEYTLHPDVSRAYIPAHDKAMAEHYSERYLGWEKVIREYNIDVVVTGMWVAQCVLWDMLSVKGQPSRPAFIIHCHSFTCLPYRVRTAGNKYAEMMYNYQMCDGVVTLSAADQRLVSCFAEHSKYISNPLTFSLQSTKATVRSKNTIVWVGRLSEEKRPMDIAYMMKRVVKVIPDARMYVIGDGDAGIKKELESLIENLNLQDNIEIIGFSQEVEKYYSMASLLVGTSQYEGFPLVLCEAMTHGLPIIMYELPWLTLTQDGRGIIQVPQKRSDLLAERVIELLQNPSEAEKIGMEGRTQIEELGQIDIGEEWRVFLKEVFAGAERSNRNPDEIETILLKYITMYAKIGKDHRVNVLNRKIDLLNKENKRKSDEVKRLKEKNEKLKNVKETLTFRIGKAILFIPRKFAKALKRIIG